MREHYGEMAKSDYNNKSNMKSDIHKQFWFFMAPLHKLIEGAMLAQQNARIIKQLYFSKREMDYVFKGDPQGHNQESQHSTGLCQYEC